MLVETASLLQEAQENKYAIGAFNVYDLLGVQAVIKTAEELKSPVILQILPRALELGGCSLVALCLEAARAAHIPVSVHLDHNSSSASIKEAIALGMPSVMVDGSHLEYFENVSFTRQLTEYAHSQHCSVEAELGRLSGTEDGLTVAEYQALMTNPDQAADFVANTGIDALAICIGNVHGKYPGKPSLDFPRLERIRAAIRIPLVLHGTSGLPGELIVHSIELGVCKFNVNTEIRNAYLQAARAYFADHSQYELTELFDAVVKSMQAPIRSKIQLFRSIGKTSIS